MTLAAPTDLLNIEDGFPVRWLKLFGHLPEVKLEDLRSPAIDVQRAARSMQRLYGPGLVGADDGWVWSKTVSAMALPRCAHPDLPDSELAEADPQKFRDLLLLKDEEISLWIQQCHAAMNEAGGNCSWPDACRREIKVHIDTTNAPSWMDVDDIFAWSQARYREIGVGLVRTQQANGAHIRQSFRRGRGWIGLAEFNSCSCSDSVFNYRDPNFNGGRRRNYNLDLHECGHNVNLYHSSGIMSPVIGDAEPYWVKRNEAGEIIYRDNSFATLARLFTGLPLDPVDPKTELTLPLSGEWTRSDFGGLVRSSNGQVNLIGLDGGVLKVLAQL